MINMTHYIVNNIDGSAPAAYMLVESLGLKTLLDRNSMIFFNKNEKETAKKCTTEEMVNRYEIIETYDDLIITLNGSGDYHHHTYGFCRGIIDQKGIDYTVINFDQHADAARLKKDVKCGAHLPPLLRDSEYAKKAIIIGALDMLTSSKRLDPKMFSYGVEAYAGVETHGSFDNVSIDPDIDCKIKTYNAENNTMEVDWHSIDDLGIEQITKKAINRIDTGSVYITVDLDVLTENYATTDWKNGNMNLNDLLYSIQKIKEKKDIIGLDICGTDGNATSLHNLYSIAAIVNEVTDGPYSRKFFIEKINEIRDLEKEI